MSSEDNKIISIQKYLQKKKKVVKEKTATGETNTSDTKEDNSQFFSKVIDMSSYLKAKNLNQETSHSFIKNQKEDAKIIPFSLKKTNKTLNFKADHQKEGQVIFLDSYFKKTDSVSSSESNKESFPKSQYKVMGFVAASLMLIFSVSIFYQQPGANSARNLSSDSPSYQYMSKEEMEDLAYRNKRSPQNQNQVLSSSEYAQHLRQKNNLIKVRGKKVNASESFNY